jgi:hypothetical protein
MNGLAQRESKVSGEGGLIADLAQGSLAARAAEPDHGEGGDGQTQEAACLNCGAKLLGRHCHHCGQAAQVHKTLGAFLHDLLHGVFHFEGKIWRTLPLLAWNPGRLTREYIDGRRANYVSPVALFLFSVFLMFAVVKQFGFDFDPDMTATINGKNLAGIEAVEQSMKALDQQRAVLVRQGKDTAQIDSDIEGHKISLKTMQRIKGGGLGEGAIKSEVPWLNRQFQAFRSNPAFLIFQLRTNAYKFSWALIPISVPFVWLLFAWRRRFGLYDHTVFVTYSLCFMMLLVIALTLASAAGLPGVAALALLIPPLHILRQLRATYAIGWLSALWRTLAVLGIALAALLLFALLIVAETGSRS